jgi:FtsP/CotA-like multicopper oxidase with cupredoxin domain
VLVFNGVLSQSDTATIEGYLACKWGLQSLLPANHPYARVCPPGITPLSSVTIPSTPAGALVEPTSLVSQNGFLTLSLTAQPDANGNPLLTYNGSSNPPTLRLLPGDVLTVNLTNNLPTPPSGAGYLNDTNLHFHGLHVSPNAPADDSIDLIALPGQSLQYKIAIPVTHPPGLYWYHSHAHGEAERQNLAGMSGAIVIDGIAQYVPQVTDLTEQILIARDTEPAGQPLPDANRKQIQAMIWAMKHANASRAKGANAMPGMNMGSTRARMTMGSAIEVLGRTNSATRNPFVAVEARYRRMSRKRFDASDGHCVGPETPARALTLNGASVPSISIQPGVQQFWRMVNAGSDTYLDVSLDNASLQIVSIDGVPISSGINTPTSLTVPDYVLPPGSRVEFLVTGPPAGTTSYLRTLCFDAGATGSAMPAAILASINPAPPAAAPPRPIQRISTRMRRYRFAHGKRRAAVVVARTQTLTYSDQNNIDGIAYDPAAPPKYYAQSGTYEEWTIVNNSQQVHTFHIHQIHFVLEAVDGIAQSQEYEMDNVNVPAASASGPGSVKILLDFTDPIDIGTFLLHCHILAHEDQGMMAKIMVGTAPPMSLNSSGVTFASPSASAQSVTIAGGAAPYSVTGCSTIISASINGTTINLSPVTNPANPGSCVLTVSDSSGQSANLPVTVTAPPSAIALSPTSVGFVSPSAAAETVSISGGTGTYSAGTCTSSGTTVATAAINAAGTGVVVTPVADGACTIVISDTASDTASLPVSVNSGTTGNPIDNLTFHHDVSRSGWNSAETALTPSSVSGGNFGVLATLSGPNLTCPGGASCPAFGKVYAQPLFASNEATSVDGEVHNLVIVATSTDQLYAIDDQTDQVVWEHNFTGTVNGTTVVQQSYADINCDDVNPNIGITGTPVIDRSQDIIYVVVPTKETTSSTTTWHMRLHAVSLSSGADENAVEVTGSVQLATGGTASTSAENNFQRGALLEANGNIYVPLASHCDYDGSTVHGWLLAYSVANNLAATGTAVNTTNATPSSGNFLGSLWMGGYGPAADAQGNIYFATGNGPWDGQNNFAMSDIELPGTLDIANISYFTPNAEAGDSSEDLDLGSGGIMLLPKLTGGNYPYVAVQQGKCGAGSSNSGTSGCQLYLLNRTSMGGKQSNNAGALSILDTSSQSNVGSGIWGGPAMMQDASGNTYVFVGGGNLTNYEVTFTNGVPTLTPVGTISGSISCLECRDSGSQPVVSSNGTTAGTAVLWALKTPANGGTITLYAFNPTNMSSTLFSASAGDWTDASGHYIAGALVSPMVANGKVYVPADGTVTVFGIK